MKSTLIIFVAIVAKFLMGFEGFATVGILLIILRLENLIDKND